MKKYIIPEMIIETYELEDAILSSTSPKLETRNETLTGFSGWQEEL